MRVVFLDFDGVLNRTTDVAGEIDEYWSAAWLDPELVTRFARLVRTTGARVVVSSSWRQRRSRVELDEILATRGYSAGVFDVTPRLPKPAEGERLVRSLEIAAWLHVHPEVSALAILDDDLEMGALTAHHVWIDPTKGLSEHDCERALAMIGDR